MFRYVLKEKHYTKEGLKERAIVGTDSFEYMQELYTRMLYQQNRKIFEHSWYSVDVYGSGGIIENDIDVLIGR